MNPITTEIRTFPTDADARAAGFTEPIPAAELERVQGMNRQQRRKWLRDQQRARAKGAR